MIPHVNILVAHYNEDTKWLENLKYPYVVISKKGIPLETKPNKGNEVSAYLEYIIENYDKLAEYTIFLHGHRTSWHCKENMDEKINKLTFRHDYYNINDKVRVERIRMMCVNTKKHIPKTIEIIGQIINKPISLDKLYYKQAAQFYVHKKCILQYPKDIYIDLYKFIQETEIPSALTSRGFEYTWHYIFTNNYTDKM